jgi:hypothetical protein
MTKETLRRIMTRGRLVRDKNLDRCGCGRGWVLYVSPDRYSPRNVLVCLLWEDDIIQEEL